MATLFGVDMQRTIADALVAAGGLERGVLVQSSSAGGYHDGSDPAFPKYTPRAPVTTRTPFQGTIRQGFQYEAEKVVEEFDSRIDIVLGTLTAGVTPAQGDQIEMRRRTFTIREVSIDAGEAIAVCLVA